jgi:HAD superfamily hydrolase (TIGR01509 family)
MPPIRAAVFDLGHTLFDFAPTEHARRLNVLRLHRRLEAALGDSVPPPASLDQALSATIARWMEEWDGDQLEQQPSEQVVSEALGRLDLAPPDDLVHDLTRLFFGREVDMPVIEPDGMAAIAALHRRGLALGCVTNTILLEEAVIDALRRLGLLGYLRSVVVSSAMGYHKPHPSLFLRALDELGVEAEEAVFVGDRLVDDIGGARAVGMRAILTHQYRHETLDGSDVAPDAVIRRLAELPQAVERIEERG